MKKFFSLAVILSLLLILPSMAMAKGNKNKLKAHGKVTAVTDTTLTLSHGKKDAATTQTITVPAGTPIKDASGADVALSGLVGKHVKIVESAADTASSITITAHKAKKNKAA